MVRIIFWVIIGVLLLIQLLAYLLWRIALYSPQKGQGDDHNLHFADKNPSLAEIIHKRIDAWNAVPFERVSIRAKDGKRLSGRYYAFREGAPIVICCHGYRGTPIRDFSVGLGIFRERGCNLLCIEHRAHLSSEGHAIGLGVMERYDILNWIEYVSDRFGSDARIVLCGISMGAASVLMLSGRNLPGGVRGIIADSPYTTPKAIFARVLRSMHLPVPIVYPLLSYGSWLFGGICLNDSTADTIAEVQKSRLPMLVIHGEADDLVPVEMAKEIANANPDMIELHTFPAAGHGLSAIVDEPRYTQIVNRYLDRIGC